jgi:hypothetical protein
MIDDATLEANVLTFREKSFSYERTVDLAGVPFAVFHRTEVESETRFRPKLVHLKVAVLRDRILGDLASETLVIAPDGLSPGPRRGATAQEVGADESEFREQGLEYVRRVGPDGSILYLPRAESDRLAELVGSPA